MTTRYHDIDGRPGALERLCEREPLWAAHRIQALMAEVATLRVAAGLTPETPPHDPLTCPCCVVWSFTTAKEPPPP